MAPANSLPLLPQFENRLRERRLSVGISQKQLAAMAGITRQAVAAVETNKYSPATPVALQLARALQCRVEDLFSLSENSDFVDAELVGTVPSGRTEARAHVNQVGDRLIARPIEGSSDLASLSAAADGLIVAVDANSGRVKVRLLTKRPALQHKLSIAGCDPAMFLAAEHVRRHTGDMLPCLMGSSRALRALKRGEVHGAGVHFGAEGSENCPELKRQLGHLDAIVVTFAHWEEGFLVWPGNPKRIRSAMDLVKPAVRIVNREIGSGARRLLDRQLDSAEISASQVRGYADEVLSHLDVAWRVASGFADAGIGVRAAAVIRGLDFVPLQRERYDLVIPKSHYQTSLVEILLNTIVGKRFRDELKALGGYDTRETGRVVAPAQ
jgi:molybdate-binding protein/DNA-binding XRE family transcriptional regulator